MSQMEGKQNGKNEYENHCRQANGKKAWRGDIGGKKNLEKNDNKIPSLIR